MRPALTYFIPSPTKKLITPTPCANCHLANKPVDIEVPQAVLPDIVFEAVVRIPYDKQLKQVIANGKKGGLNIGTVLGRAED